MKPTPDPRGTGTGPGAPPGCPVVADAPDMAFISGFEELRGLIRADGGDLRVTSAGPTTVNLELVLETANCAECIMPRPFLEQVALDVFRAAGAAVSAVVIHDPRELPGPGTPPAEDTPQP